MSHVSVSLNASRGPDAATSKARLRVWLRILKVSRMIERELRERLRVEFDTTLPRFDVMESTLVFIKAGASKPDSWPEDLRARIAQELGGRVKDDA